MIKLAHSILLATLLLTGCTYWDQAIIAVDDAINTQPAPVEDSQSGTPEPEQPAPPVIVPDEEPDPKPEPECSVPPLPTQRDIERLAALWKPVSESNGRLVTLLDRRARTHVVKAEIVYKGTSYETGRFDGDTHNGCRPHHRWGHPGRVYASGCVLLYTIRGEGGDWLVSYYVGDSARRLEWSGPTGIISPDGRVVRR